MLAVPLYILYEFGIFIAAFTMKKREQAAQSNVVSQPTNKEPKNSEANKSKNI
jgi:Sec-independent protein secretion pathway component TatC